MESTLLKKEYLSHKSFRLECEITGNNASQIVQLLSFACRRPKDATMAISYGRLDI